MILDGHVHLLDERGDRDGFLRRLCEAGVSGCLLISLPPAVFSDVCQPRTHRARLEHLSLWKGDNERIFPFYWIDPMESDAVEQVETAVDCGVEGFKVTCSRFYPGDPKAIEVFRSIAECNKPILFHSGILWDGRSSSRFNHPENFEDLLEIPRLRFCLAHVGWPWCDELIAVYGKFLNAYAYRPELSVEMFVDLSPGTPAVYRREVLMKLFGVGYDVQNNVIFGSDCRASDYNVNWVRQWINRDNAIYDDLQIEKGILDRIYSANLLRFLGLSSDDVPRKILRIGE